MSIQYDVVCVSDWWYPVLIVECLFVGAHSAVWIHEVFEDDPDDSRARGFYDSPYIDIHTTTVLLSARCSGSPGVHLSRTAFTLRRAVVWLQSALAVVIFNSSNIRGQR